MDRDIIEGAEAKAAELRVKAAGVSDDQAMRDAINALSDGMTGANIGARRSVAGPWAKAFFAALRPTMGQKDLLSPSGAVGVPAVTPEIEAMSPVGRAESML